MRTPEEGAAAVAASQGEADSVCCCQRGGPTPSHCSTDVSEMACVGIMPKVAGATKELMTGINPTPLTFSQDQSGRSGQNPEGSRAARLLHMVRRVERNLMSYERTGGAMVRRLQGCCPGSAALCSLGQQQAICLDDSPPLAATAACMPIHHRCTWQMLPAAVDFHAREWCPQQQVGLMRPLFWAGAGWLQGEPTRVTARMEIRPAAEMGPIICCLDTSGAPCARSM